MYSADEYLTLRREARRLRAERDRAQEGVDAAAEALTDMWLCLSAKECERVRRAVEAEKCGG